MHLFPEKGIYLPNASEYLVLLASILGYAKMIKANVLNSDAILRGSATSFNFGFIPDQVKLSTVCTDRPCPLIDARWDARL